MKRQIRIVGDVAFVPLTRGYEAVIDAVDVPAVEPYYWRARPHRQTVYAQRSAVAADGRKTTIMLHRWLVQGVALVDHRDGDGLNNRRTNLRSADPGSNTCNRHRQRNDSSGLRGVTLHKQTGRWQAQVKHRGINHYLGLFDTKEEASAVRTVAALRLHGEFAWIDRGAPA